MDLKKLLIAVVFLVASCAARTDGWEISTRYYSMSMSGSDERTEKVMLLDGYMKMVNQELTTIFNLKEDKLIYINSNSNTYWEGSPADFIREARIELELMVEEKLLHVPEDDREMVRAMYHDMIEYTFPTTPIANPEMRTYSVERVHEKDAVAGYSTVKYDIFENAYPLESLWLAKDLPIAKDFSFRDLAHFLNQLAGGAYASSFESSEQYFNLLEKGYPVKVQIRRGDGSIQVSEVTEAKRVNLTLQDFSVPADCQRSTLSGVGIWEGFM